ncbi:MAG: hypothetical protein H8E30_04635 [Alphaproteobacteria bacterium]|nr:hypothetical protein [Alphaproteobacteria bacterium]
MDVEVEVEAEPAVPCAALVPPLAAAKKLASPDVAATATAHTNAPIAARTACRTEKGLTPAPEPAASVAPPEALDGCPEPVKRRSRDS